MKTFKELMEGPRDRQYMASMLINETEKVKAAFKRYEKFGKVTVNPPQDDGDEFFNVTVELKWQMSSSVINSLNKDMSKHIKFTDESNNKSECDIMASGGNVILEFFVDIPE